MLALTSFLYVTFQVQESVRKDIAELQDIDNIVLIAGDTGSYYLKYRIEDTVSDPNSKDDAFWASFSASESDNIKSYILNKMPSQYISCIKNTNVQYMTDVVEYRHGFDSMGYDAIVLTIEVETKNTIEKHNIAYFINNASGYSNDGVLFKKGEFVYSWIS